MPPSGFTHRKSPHHHHLLILLLILLVIILILFVIILILLVIILIIFVIILILLNILLLLLLLQPDDVYKPAGAEVRGASKSRGGGTRPREGRSFPIVMLVMLIVIGHQSPSSDCFRRCMRPRESHVQKNCV